MRNRRAFFVCDKTVIKHKRVLNDKKFQLPIDGRQLNLRNRFLLQTPAFQTLSITPYDTNSPFLPYL